MDRNKLFPPRDGSGKCKLGTVGLQIFLRVPPAVRKPDELSGPSGPSLPGPSSPRGPNSPEGAKN